MAAKKEEEKEEKRGKRLQPESQQCYDPADTQNYSDAASYTQHVIMREPGRFDLNLRSAK